MEAGTLMKRIAYAIGYVLGYALFLAAVALLLAWPLMGCCPGIDAEEPIHFDETFTELEQAVLVSAVTEWAVAMDRDMPPMSFDEPHGWHAGDWLDDRSVVHRMTEDEAVVIREFWSPKFAGLASPGGSIILAIERLADPAKLLKVMRHELGHRYGCLEHRDAPSLMVGSVSRDLDCIDQGTLDEVCDEQPNGCGPDARETCQ